MIPQPLDIIGDIHGHADELETLLATLGYIETDGVYRHTAGRRVVFLGDYVDRGPKIRRVLQIVRGMVEADQARALMGNHEINALRVSTFGRDGLPIRPRSGNGFTQHAATFDQISDPHEWATWMHWIARLPISLEWQGLRFVHACWHDEAIRFASTLGPLEGDLLESVSHHHTPEHDQLGYLLSGPVAALPEGYRRTVRYGGSPHRFRIRWWQDLAGLTCREAVVLDDPSLPDLPPLWHHPASAYPPEAPLTFFGHYALTHPIPAPLLPNLACLDYGMGKGGFLCAYRWNGEQKIRLENYVTAGRPLAIHS